MSCTAGLSLLASNQAGNCSEGTSIKGTYDNNSLTPKSAKDQKLFKKNPKFHFVKYCKTNGTM